MPRLVQGLASRRQADYAWVVLARVLAVALDRGWIDVNPCEKGGRLYNQSRRDRIWTLEDEIAFLERALVTFILPSRWHSGQASGKVTYLKLTWSAYDGNKISLRQSKTGSRVVIPVGLPLKAALESRRLFSSTQMASHGQPMAFAQVGERHARSRVSPA